VILWNSRYLYDRYFAPGFEIQGDFGKPDEVHGFNQQEHYIGPSACGQIIPHLKCEAAHVFGVSNAASKGAARLLLEYEAFFYMPAILIIVFREIIEARLIVGIVLVATRGVPQRGWWVSYGIAAGVVGACIMAAFARSISKAMEASVRSC
jgi:hypothetical protein